MNKHKIKHMVIFLMTGCMLAMLTSLPAVAGVVDPTLVEIMASADPDTPLPVIIRLIDAPHSSSNHASPEAAGKIAELLQENAAASQGLIKALLKSRGITGIVSLWIINGLAVELTPDQIMEIADHPDVESIVFDAIVTAPAIPEASSQAIIGDAWDNLGAIDAPAMWNAGIDGSGVVVATMDTGADIHHPDLAGNWRGGANSWYDPNNEHAQPYDGTGHGTQVLGVLTGGANSGRLTGVAPGAHWIAVKIFNDAGDATYSGIHLGFQWILDPDGLADTPDAPHIVNNSWGLANTVGQCVLEFKQDIMTLKDAGIAVVFSGGNYGPGNETGASPANYANTLAVGAVDENLTAATNGSRGPSACDGSYFPDISAPGIGIYTTDRTSGGAFPDSYVLATGSSFAAPHAAGAMALLKDAYPGATVGELENALTQSAVDLGDIGSDNVYGRGLIDLAAADGRLTNPAGCEDNDNDGYFSGAGCGTPVDCDDADSAINPSAAEIKNDGVDQNCNGYDLTIAITSAVYLAADDKLSVTATSDLGANAGLDLVGYGAMKWDRKKTVWKIDVRSAGGDPGQVVVRGIEGSQSVTVTVDNGSGSGGGNGGGGGKGKNK